MNTPSPRDIADRVLELAFGLLIRNSDTNTGIICLKSLLAAYIEALRVEANELEDEQPEICTCFHCSTKGLSEIEPSKPITFTDIIQKHIESRNDFIMGNAIDDIFNDDTDNEKETTQ